MVISFERDLGIESSVAWARQEGWELNHHTDPVVIDDPAGTPGQYFCTKLMWRLFVHLGLLA